MKSKIKKLSEVIGDYSMAGSRRNDAPGNVRSGQFVKSQRTNVLTDEENEISQYRKTVRLIVVRDDGKVLCISKPDIFHNTLPGGGIEPGESAEDAARRELWEETGLEAGDITMIRKDVVDRKVVTLFLVKSVTGKLRSSPEGKPAWVDPGELCTTRFGKYHSYVLKNLGIL